MENPKFESFINRESPEVPVRISLNGEVAEFILNYENAVLVFHDEAYSQFDHIAVFDESVGVVNLYRSPMVEELMEQLNNLEFDAWYKKYPSEDDESTWFKMEMYRLNKELDDL